MKKLFINSSQIVTCNSNGKNYKRGKELSELEVLENHSILCENGIIKDVIPNYSAYKIEVDERIDLSDKVILPGLIDCHTHTAFDNLQTLVLI